MTARAFFNCALALVNADITALYSDEYRAKFFKPSLNPFNMDLNACVRSRNINTPFASRMIRDNKPPMLLPQSFTVSDIDRYAFCAVLLNRRCSRSSFTCCLAIFDSSTSPCRICSIISLYCEELSGAMYAFPD